MAKRTIINDFDLDGQRMYETGVDHGVFYPFAADTGYGKGEVWNGLTNVTEGTSGGEATPLYADNVKYLNLYSEEEFNPTIEAYWCPDGFMECDGLSSIVKGVYASQQARKQFGFSYRTLIGNDEVGDAAGFKLHLVYACKASPSEKARETTNETPGATTMSWACTTTKQKFTGEFAALKPTAHIIIDSRDFTSVNPETGAITYDTKFQALMDKLYGKDDTESASTPDGNDPTLPTPDEVVAIFAED